MRGAIVAAVFSAVLGACQCQGHPPAAESTHGDTTAAPPPPASGGRPPRPVPTYAPGPTSAALCDAFRARARARDAKLPPVADVGGGGFVPSTFDDACFATPGGAWALELGAIRAQDSVRDGARIHVSASGSFRAVHLDATGKRAEGLPHAFEATEWRSFRFETLLFDYDGDGEPELLLKVDTTVHSGTGVARLEVLTGTGGAVRPYPPAASFAATSWEDVDGDGRPDLLFAGEPPEDIEEPTGDMNTSTFHDLLLAAHSVDGGRFSASDGAAADFARSQCPAPPSTIVAMADGAVNEPESVKNVHCARLWGVPTADLKAQIARDCVPPTDHGRGPRGPHTCSNIDLMMEWAAFVPPVSLAGTRP